MFISGDKCLLSILWNRVLHIRRSSPNWEDGHLLRGFFHRKVVFYFLLADIGGLIALYV